MEQIKKEITKESALLEKFGADERFNPPDSYPKQASFFGDGKYPPDWAQRREAIWWLQDNECGRCGRRQEKRGHVHHIKPLLKGGSNSLNNLVGLCVDCHALLHPAVTDLNGNWKTAPKYPAENAVSEIAVIRRDRNGTFEETFEEEIGVDVDFKKLAEETEVTENYYAAQSPVVYETDPSIARQFSTDQDLHPVEKEKQAIEELNRLLLLRGRVPENGLYNNRRLAIETSIKGILGWLSPFEPEITVKPERPSEHTNPYSAVTEEVNRNGSADREFIFSEDVNDATVTVTGGDGEVTDKNVSFSDENNNQSVSVSVMPPPLSTATLGSYLWSAGKKTYILPLLYVLLWILIVPFTGLVLIMALFGVMAGAVGTVGWFLVALLFGEPWTTVGEMALATVIALFIGGIAITILEQFGIEFEE
ncbi:HNH endonuclease [Halorubrum sp. DTA98]|uniref:HNH endonuclease n=1 Tax=Halorubrum sp. DTA98 TaxID=3402163 RepID=UPI003AAD5370